MRTGPPNTVRNVARCGAHGRPSSQPPPPAPVRSAPPFISPHINDTPASDAPRASRTPVTVMLTNLTLSSVAFTRDRPPAKLVPLKRQSVRLAPSRMTGATKERVVRSAGVSAKSLLQLTKVTGASDDGGREVADGLAVRAAVAVAVAVVVGVALGVVLGVALAGARDDDAAGVDVDAAVVVADDDAAGLEVGDVACDEVGVALRVARALAVATEARVAVTAGCVVVLAVAAAEVAAATVAAVVGDAADVAGEAAAAVDDAVALADATAEAVRTGDDAAGVADEAPAVVCRVGDGRGGVFRAGGDDTIGNDGTAVGLLVWAAGDRIAGTGDRGAAGEDRNVPAGDCE